MAGLRVEDAPSPNFDERGETPIDLVVLHYTGMASGRAALERLRDPEPVLARYAGDLATAHATGDPDTRLPTVSAHYVVEEDGRVFALVDEAHRAWHAGVAHWAGEGDVNARSIGIEMVNGGHDFGLPGYPREQIVSAVSLVADIVARHRVPAWRVVGHSDVAPERKADPGEHFPWEVLAEAGLAIGSPGVGDHSAGGAFLREGSAGEAVARLQARLMVWGYGLVASGGYDARTAAVVTAFQRHHAPDRKGAGGPFGVWTPHDEAALAGVFADAARAARPDGAGPPPDDPAAAFT